MLQSICLCPMCLALQWCILGVWLLWNTNRKPHAGSLTHWLDTGSGRNGNETIAGTASEAFTGWLHYRQGLHLQHLHGLPPRTVIGWGHVISSPSRQNLLTLMNSAINVVVKVWKAHYLVSHEQCPVQLCCILLLLLRVKTVCVEVHLHFTTTLLHRHCLTSHLT